MKAKKFFANVVVLLIFAAAVFFAGWIQFLVKPGFCAVMKSKTGGIYGEAVVPGKFLWRWERLLPTNVSLEIFSLSPRKISSTVSGELPGAALYSSRLSEKNVDFSYGIEFSVGVSISAEEILRLVKENVISSDADLDSLLESRAKLLSSLLADSILKNSAGKFSVPSGISQAEISQITEKNPDFKGISVSSVEILNAKIPDVALYEKARENYASYLNLVNQRLEARAESQAEIFLEQDRMVSLFEKLGSMMQKYPQVEELLKIGDVQQIVNTLGKGSY